MRYSIETQAGNVGTFDGYDAALAAWSTILATMPAWAVMCERDDSERFAVWFPVHTFRG